MLPLLLKGIVTMFIHKDIIHFHIDAISLAPIKLSSENISRLHVCLYFVSKIKLRPLLLFFTFYITLTPLHIRTLRVPDFI